MTIRAPHALVAALCVGVASANAARVSAPAVAVAACALAASTSLVAGDRRLAVLGVALALAGWWWGSVRLDALDRSVLAPFVGTAERARLDVTGPTRRSRFQLRVPVLVRRFGRRMLREQALLALPPGRAPPQGAVVSAIVTVAEPRGPEHGFDERTWLRRRGVHVVLRADGWRSVGVRGGLAGVADALRARVARPLTAGTGGDRRAVLEGIVLGDDQAVPAGLRDRFRAAGLYHLLAVSGQNVALVAGGALIAAWSLGLPRAIGHAGALAAIAAYVLAVGPQPSVIRAGIVGALGSIAWLAARQRDRWHFVLLAALALLGWNPYTLFDPGFELSFAAVAAIFLWARPMVSALEDGYPLPHWLAEALALSSVCALATAPLLWLQFHAIPVLAVPANVIAAPAMPPLLALALLSAIVDPLAPGAASQLAWLAGWFAEWLALCARLVGAVPFAQVTSSAAAAVLAAGGAGAAAYAWRRWRISSPST